MDNVEKISIAQLSAPQICDIIKVCSQSGVSELKFGDLHVSFGKPTKWEEFAESTPAELSSSDRAKSEAQLQEIADHDRTRAEVALREQQLAEMAITDPLEFEKLIAQGEIG